MAGPTVTPIGPAWPVITVVTPPPPRFASMIVLPALPAQ
jgi:hypothetical protein